ncbi:adenylyltransferase/cytidyltransferase family protein [Endozoicomonas sp. Mp262]|uniref:adenylyltransferase/cytidyltransferase family protein n=1 Tax=Endozoicomonas sp. Mp262 TaxID=2919499 RepID=UPI0021DAD58F
MSKVKIGVFGSAFDPPTRGHLDVISQAAPYFDKILLVPSASHAFAKTMQLFSHRLAMLDCFVTEAAIDSCDMEVCDLEYQLLAETPDSAVYTYDLMDALETYYGKTVELSFIRGPDNAVPEVWNRFYRAGDIEKRWKLFTAKERVQARSSQVRQAIAGGLLESRCENGCVLNSLLLPTVQDYIQGKGLYQS